MNLLKLSVEFHCIYRVPLVFIRFSRWSLFVKYVRTTWSLVYGLIREIFVCASVFRKKKIGVYREHTSSGLPKDCEGETGNKLINLPKEMKLSDEDCE